jgi:hypothetical protein
MPFYNLTEFLKLSAVLNYQLSAKQINWMGIASILVGKKDMPEREREILIGVFEYINSIYGLKQRRLGARAVLHPLRVTALMSEVSEDCDLLQYFTALLHDRFEDIEPERYLQGDRLIPDRGFEAILELLPEREQWFLMERLQWLTKRPGDSYYAYIGRFFEKAVQTPEVVRVKLADRLDNTLDMSIDLEDPLEEVDFFENIFQILFNNSFKGATTDVPHPAMAALNSAERLYQLFKNIILMSLIRQKGAGAADLVSKYLFENLTIASIKEAQRIALHIFNYHETDVLTLRQLIRETMDYVYEGGIDTVTAPTGGSRLDGLFVSRFDDPVKENLQTKLAELFEDKHLMIQAAIAFIVIFMSFLNDSEYFVRGISAEGVQPTRNPEGSSL